MPQNTAVHTVGTPFSRPELSTSRDQIASPENKPWNGTGHFTMKRHRSNGPESCSPATSAPPTAPLTKITKLEAQADDNR